MSLLRLFFSFLSLHEGIDKCMLLFYVTDLSPYPLIVKILRIGNYTSPNGEARSRPKAKARSKTFYSYSIFKDLKYFTHSFMNFDRYIHQTQDLK